MESLVKLGILKETVEDAFDEYFPSEGPDKAERRSVHARGVRERQT